MTLNEVVVPESPRLPLRVLLADDLPAIHRLAVAHLGKPATAPPLDLVVRPIWTTWAHYKMHTAQAQALAFADELVSRGFPRPVFEIDDRWQSAYGDLSFDPARFPDPRVLVEQLHARGFRITLGVPPFFERKSNACHEAAGHGLLLRNGFCLASSDVRTSMMLLAFCYRATWAATSAVPSRTWAAYFWSRATNPLVPRTG